MAEAANEGANNRGWESKGEGLGKILAARGAPGNMREIQLKKPGTITTSTKISKESLTEPIQEMEKGRLQACSCL